MQDRGPLQAWLNLPLGVIDGGEGALERRQFPPGETKWNAGRRTAEYAVQTPDLCKESGLSKRSPRACRPGPSRPRQAAARCKKLPVCSLCHAGAGDGWLRLRWVVRLSVPFWDRRGWWSLPVPDWQATTSRQARRAARFVAERWPRRMAAWQHRTMAASLVALDHSYLSSVFPANAPRRYCCDTAKMLTVMSPQGRQCPYNDSSVYGEARPASRRGGSGSAWSSSCHEAGETSRNKLVSVFCSHSFRDERCFWLMHARFRESTLAAFSPLLLRPRITAQAVSFSTVWCLSSPLWPRQLITPSFKAGWPNMTIFCGCSTNINTSLPVRPPHCPLFHHKLGHATFKYIVEAPQIFISNTSKLLSAIPSNRTTRTTPTAYSQPKRLSSLWQPRYPPVRSGPTQLQSTTAFMMSTANLPPCPGPPPTRPLPPVPTK